MAQSVNGNGTMDRKSLEKSPELCSPTPKKRAVVWGKEQALIDKSPTGAQARKERQA
jgi:hypothetical protein